MRKFVLILALIGLMTIGVSQNVSADDTNYDIMLISNTPGKTNLINANDLDVSEKLPVMCENYFDGCNNCFQENGVAGCTQMYCDVIEEQKCTKREGYKTNETPYYILLDLNEQSCKDTNGGMYDGDNKCYFKRPTIHSLNTMQNLADYDNGNLRVDLNKLNCEKNGGNKTVDGNGIEVCFIKLDPVNFDECTGLYGKTTRSIPAQCGYGGKVFVQDMKDVLKNNLGKKELDLANNFNDTVDKQIQNLSDTEKYKYKNILKFRIDQIINFIEVKYKGLFLYVKELL